MSVPRSAANDGDSADGCTHNEVDTSYMLRRLSLTDRQPRVTNLYTGIGCMFVNTPCARAAICICTDGDPDSTMIEILDSRIFTNQQAELHAIYRALTCITTEIEVHIISESSYMVDYINEWLSKWKSNIWDTIVEDSSSDKSIIKDIMELIEYLLKQGKTIEIYSSSTSLHKVGSDIARKYAESVLVQEVHHF